MYLIVNAKIADPDKSARSDKGLFVAHTYKDGHSLCTIAVILF